MDKKQQDRDPPMDLAEHRPLAGSDADAVAERRGGSALVIHEVVRLHGEEELRRPNLSLFCSGLAAGLAISASVLAKAFIRGAVPADASWATLPIAFGYTIGFVIVIIGRLQLFTESTITAILPLATRPTRRKLMQTLRLWSIVFVANMIGTLIVAALIQAEVVVTPEARTAVVALSRELLAHDFKTTLSLGIPAGFLIASVPWLLPNARGSEFWVVVLVTWMIGIGGFSHVVAGSTEAWTLWLSGTTGLAFPLMNFILPALIGNLIGGTGLFALLAHGQVRLELADTVDEPAPQQAGWREKVKTITRRAASRPAGGRRSS